MESRNDEFLRAARYGAMEAHGTLVAASLAEIVEETGLVGRIYSIELEPNEKFFKMHPDISPERAVWVVAIERTMGPHDGNTLCLNLYAKSDLPLPRDAYEAHKEFLEEWK
ncbi:Uncharacterised protein [uncultured archaeon]|nr:Uncharacterised protein [uncultured archaeon]